MSQSNQVTINNNTYQISETAKRYTFKDYGFTETKSGKLQFVRGLTTTASSPKLKITVASDLSQLKISVTTANGMKPFNLFSSAQQADKQEQFYYLLDDMVAFGCLTKI